MGAYPTNGEGVRLGARGAENNNNSWNMGAEGPTDDTEILERKVRSRMTTVQGVECCYSVPAAIRHFFIPAQLTRLDASGVPPPRQWVSRETAP